MDTNNTVLTTEEVKAVEELASIPEFDLSKGIKIGVIAALGTAIVTILVKMIKKYGLPKVKALIDNARAKKEQKKKEKAMKKAGYSKEEVETVK